LVSPHVARLRYDRKRAQHTVQVEQAKHSFVQDFRLCQLRLLMYKNFRSSTLRFLVEFYVLILVMVAFAPDQNVSYSMASSSMLYLNFLMTTYVIEQAYLHFPVSSRGHSRQAKMPQPVRYSLNRPSGSESSAYPGQGGQAGPHGLFSFKEQLCLEQLMLAWNIARHITYRNDKMSKEPTSSSGAQSQRSVDGLVPLLGDAYRVFYAWFDDSEEWPHIHMPSRLRSSPAYILTQDQGLGDTDRELEELLPGEGDLEYGAKVLGAEQYGTFAYVHELEDRVVVAFNGSSRTEHYLTDLEYSLEPLQLLGEEQAAFITSDEELVHTGFHQAYISMHDSLLQWIRQSPSRADKSLMVVGHSMGGALATLCCRYMSEVAPYSQNKSMLGLISFGSPRVGNEVFASALEGRVGEIWRLVCENDLVTTLPPAPISCRLCCERRRDPYVHAGIEVLLTHDGYIAVNPCFAEGHLLGEVQSLMGVSPLTNHYHFRYGECLQHWISNIHPHEEASLQAKMMPLPNW